METRRILFLLRQPPYSSDHALEAIESVLVAGVFEQQVVVLFRDDGVWQLLKNQSGRSLGTRTVGKVVQALPEYEVNDIYVCAESLAERGLTVDDLVLRVTALSPHEQQALIAGQQAVMND
jgi:tRNA 2-thiouridine synthesizing protein C